MAEWKKLEFQDGMWPDPIIDEIRNAEHGFIFRFKDGTESDIYISHTVLDSLENVTDYLICEPHVHKDMIIRWAQTGQPVYRYRLSNEEPIDPSPAWKKASYIYSYVQNARSNTAIT